MTNEHLALVQEVHRKAAEQMRAEGKLDVPEPPPIPHSQLPELPSDNPLCREWNTYRREVAALLAAGFESGWVLVKGEKLYGLYASWKMAYLAGLEKVVQQEMELPFLVQQVRSAEPVSSIERLRKACPRSPLTLKQTA
jgi:hypothetical protein